MLIHRIYSLQEEEKALVYEAALNPEGKILHFIDYADDPFMVSQFQYDAKGQLIHQKDQQQGLPYTAQAFAYNENGEIVDEKLFFGEELYEHRALENLPNGFIRRYLQDGEEVERLENVRDGENWTSKFYSGQNLEETQEYTYDPSTRCATKSVHILESGDKYRIVEYFNAEDDLLKIEEFDDRGDRISSIECEYAGGLKVQENIRQFGTNEHYSNFYTYDESERLVKFECRSAQDHLLAFRSVRYDENGRIAEEAGLNNAYSDSESGYHTRFNRFHLLHEYTDGELPLPHGFN